MAKWDFLNKILNKEVDESEIESEDYAYDINISDVQSPPLKSVPNKALEIKIHVLKTFDELLPLAHHVLENRVLMLNLEDMSEEDTKRVIDYCGGLTFAIEGSIKRSSKNTYIIAPKNVNVEFDMINVDEAKTAIFDIPVTG